MWETRVWSLGRKDSLEKGMATHSGILAWQISWTEEPGGLCTWGHKESDMTEWLSTAQACMNFMIRKQEFCMAFWLGGWGSHVLYSFIFDNELNFLSKSLAWRWSTLTNGNLFSFHSSNHSEKYFQQLFHLNSYDD